MADKGNFRARRLSVSDTEKGLAATSIGGGPGASRPARARRLSLSPEIGVAQKAEEVPFPKTVVGTYSCHGVEPGARNGETNAKINQDRGAIVYPFGQPNPDFERALFIVMDGHGSNGDKVSDFAIKAVADHMGDSDNEKFLCSFEDIQDAFCNAFVAADEALRKNPNIDAELSGTTAVACLCVHDKKNKKTAIYSANAGDSRAVLCAANGVTRNLTTDQKPDTFEEQKRIKKKGGYVSPPEPEWGGPARVWLDASQTLPGLAMGRSIGDHLVKSIGVIAEPYVSVEEIDLTKDMFMVLASDGVWEFIESVDAVEILTKCNVKEDASKACEKLIETAASAWRREEGDYRDDITAICVTFSKLFDKPCS